MSSDEQSIYRARFDAGDVEKKARLWNVLCGSYLQRYVDLDATVLDLGAGYCEFINAIRCGPKYALDVNEDTVAFAAEGVKVLSSSAQQIPLEDSSVDLVFASNFFEHVPDKAALTEILTEVHRVLCDGGSLLILQPNIRYAYKVYWDFLDHHTPLSHVSMVEALSFCGFNTEMVIPRFLPYSTKSGLPTAPSLLRLYLHLRPAWRLFGRQMFIVARSKSASSSRKPLH